MLLREFLSIEIYPVQPEISFLTEIYSTFKKFTYGISYFVLISVNNLISHIISRFKQDWQIMVNQIKGIIFAI